MRKRIWVPDPDCAKIIGRRGEQLKEIQNTTSTKVHVQPEHEVRNAWTPPGALRFVEIIGSRPGVAQAEKMILQIATFAKGEYGEVLKHPDPSGGKGNEGSLGRSEVSDDRRGRIGWWLVCDGSSWLVIVVTFPTDESVQGSSS